MPKIEFKAENKATTTNFDYPKLKLKNGEYARILLLEDPIVEYVHTLRKPQIINGIPQTVQEERRDGTKYTTNKMDFLSRPLCLGDAGILEDKGSDPKNCPMCALAKDNPDASKAPDRRYAMHIIRYRTKSGGTTVTDPFSVETLVWSFTDRIFNTIVDFREEWEDLRKHDLLLGPCQNEMYQKFDISVAAKAEWLLDETNARRKLTIDTFKNNQIPDLTIAAGSKKERKWVEEDIAKINEAWAQVNGYENDSPSGSTLSTDLDDLMESTVPKPAAKTDDEGWHVDTTDAKSSDDILADLDAEVEAPAKAKAEVKETVPPSDEAESSDAGSFDDLLADL